MAKTDLKLKSTNGYGDDITTTISYVNPDAEKNDILEFTQALNALTTNTYKETDKVTTTNVDLEQAQVTPTLTASKTTLTASDFSQGESGNFYHLNFDLPISYNGNGYFYVKGITQPLFQVAIWNKNGSPHLQLWYYFNDISSGTHISFTLGTTETASYKSAEIAFNVTT